MDPLVEYETAIDAAPVDAGAAPDPADTAPEPAAADLAPEPVDAAPANPLEGVDIDALRALAEAAPHLLTAGQRNEIAPQQQQEPMGPPDFDPLDPDSMAARLDWERQQTLAAIAEMVDPLRQQAVQQAEQEQQSLLNDAAHDIEVKKGEFLGDDEARKIARSQMVAQARAMFPEYAARYGNTDRAAELALEAAHASVKGYQDAIARQAVEQHVNRNAKLADLHTEPGGGGASGVTVPPPITAGTYRPGMISEKYGARANALRDGN